MRRKPMEYQHISLSHQEDAVALITLSRPEAANALNQRMGEELTHAVYSATQNPALRVIILTGSGNRAFCAGADLKERKGMTQAQWAMQHHAFETALHAIMKCPKPIIAAVNGAAFGGGLELALACDFMYASSNARFGLTEATLGIIPGMGGTQTLPRAVGVRRAKELMFSGKAFDTNEAFTMGLVNAVFPAERLLPELLIMAQCIANNAPLAVAAIKLAVDQGTDLPLAKACENDLILYNSLLETNDRHEGINAFNEKRKPRFSGN